MITEKVADPKKLGNRRAGNKDDEETEAQSLHEMVALEGKSPSRFSGAPKSLKTTAVEKTAWPLGWDRVEQWQF